MADVIEQLTAADPELGNATNPVRLPAELLASIMDQTDSVLALPKSPKRSWRPLAAALTGFGAVLVVGALTLLVINDSSGGPDGNVASNPDALITSEIILQDGVVTEEEYRAGAEAVVVCLAGAGIEAVLDFDSPNGGAGFLNPKSEGFPTSNLEEIDRCSDLHLSQNVSFGWMVTLGQLDLDEKREQETAVMACVEERTGEDFGELSYDQFGYPTEQGQQSARAAGEYQNDEPWGRCNNDLGYEDEYKAETRALLECVEKRTGEDFGELDFDATGHPTEEGWVTVRAATAYEDHVPWNACVEELGLSSQNLEG